MFAIML